MDRDITGSNRLAAIARLAREADLPGLAADADRLAERLQEGRFYVACVGQFKRGKSTLVNALVGHPVLPTGVIPITAAVTIVRHGETLGARVRFNEREWEGCEPSALATYVSEEQNPGNEKGVAAVEVFVPSPLLEAGMCLVDTPGIGSVSTASTAATRAFVPHIDAAIVVLGADPPISGEEMALIELDERARAEAVRFTERILAERLGRTVGPILEVSATERLEADGPDRDWPALRERLTTLTQRSGAELVRAAEQRGTAALIERFLRDLTERHAALVRPIEESEARVRTLVRAVADAERALEELGSRFVAVQDRLTRTLADERDRFFARALPEARHELQTTLPIGPRRGLQGRGRAIEHAIAVTQRWLDRWRQEQEPRAETLFSEAFERFIELLNGLQERLSAVPGLEDLPHLELDPGFTAKSQFHYTEMLMIAPAGGAAWLLDLVAPRGMRRKRV